MSLRSFLKTRDSIDAFRLERVILGSAEIAIGLALCSASRFVQLAVLWVHPMVSVFYTFAAFKKVWTTVAALPAQRSLDMQRVHSISRTEVGSDPELMEYSSYVILVPVQWFATHRSNVSRNCEDGLADFHGKTTVEVAVADASKTGFET
eukprot:2325591-Amphidinium_carterae.1